MRILCLKSIVPALIILWLLSGAGIFALDPKADLTRYGHQSWQTDSGLPQDSVHAILQTSDGYLWLGTERGLARFDGVSFTTYDKRNGLPGTFIQSLFEDQSHRLWVCTTAGLALFDGNGFEAFTSKNGLPSNDVHALYQQPDGSLWALTALGVARFSQNQFQPVSGITGSVAAAAGHDGDLWFGSSDGLFRLDTRTGKVSRELGGEIIPSSVRGLLLEKSGQLWIATDSGLYLHSASHLQKLSGLPDNDIRILTADGHGGVWVGTPNGVAVISAGKIKTIPNITGGKALAIFPDSEGSVWIATSRGLARLSSGHEVVVPLSDTGTDYVLSVFEDREGSLWIGTEGSGLVQLHDQKFMTYTAKDGLPAAAAITTATDNAGRVWVGSSGGGLAVLQSGVWKTYTTASGLPSNNILSLASGNNGDLWAGTPDGLAHFSGSSFRIFTTSDGLPDDFVRSLLVEPNGTLWIGTRRGLSRFQSGRFTNFSVADGLPSDLVGALLRQPDGTLWVATSNGLGMYRQGGFAAFTDLPGASRVITALHPLSDGAILVAVNGEGLMLFSKGHFAPWKEDAGLPDVIYSIMEDSQQGLWFNSPAGVFYLPLDAAAATRFSSADGLFGSVPAAAGHPTSARSADGRLWFATTRGVACIDPARAHWNTVPPPVVIEQVLANEEQVPVSGSVKLAPGRSRLTFSYAALSFISPQRVRYKYKLDGIDKDWIDAGNRRTAFYTNLTPGSYRFHVIAANADGIWNQQGAALGLRLEPHFYQTRWFYLLLLIAAFLIIFSLYRLRMHMARKEFAAVLDERTRIAREVHDTLAQSFVGISVGLELLSAMLKSAPDEVRSQLEQTRILVRESLADARRSIWKLRGAPEQYSSLPDSLSKAALALNQQQGPEVNVQVSGLYRPLDQEREDELLRIAKEAIANAVRHANATKVNVELAFAQDRVRLSISDNGVGIQPEKLESPPAGHFGLVGLRERAEKIGGKLTITSSGNGTTVQVEAPAVERHTGARA